MHCYGARNSRNEAPNMHRTDGPLSSPFMACAKPRLMQALILSSDSVNTSLVRLSPMTGGSRVKSLSLTGEDA
jgi:hypothetical protein